MNTYNTFTFSTVPNIVCETGAVQKLGALLRQQFPSVKKALIVTDRGFLGTGLIDAPKASLL